MKKIEPKGTKPAVPRAKSITAEHMRLAYGIGGDTGDRRQRRRIEEFGRINRETLRGLGARIVKVKR